MCDDVLCDVWDGVLCDVWDGVLCGMQGCVFLSLYMYMKVCHPVYSNC